MERGQRRIVQAPVLQVILRRLLIPEGRERCKRVGPGMRAKRCLLCIAAVRMGVSTTHQPCRYTETSRASFGAARRPCSCWWISAAATDGEVTRASTGCSFPMLIGTSAFILTSGAMCTGLSLCRPENCDWASTRRVALITCLF